MKILNPYVNPDKKRDQKLKEQAFDPSMPRKKKMFGQHFLRKQSVVDHMIDKVVVTPETSVLEIGCGDGFLTRSILAQTKCKQLWSYEIDPEWVEYVKNQVKDSRLHLKLKDILSVDLASDLSVSSPWVILANLPYQITFPIMFVIQKNKALFQEGVVMVQEEVAQKIVAGKGKKYNPTSLFLQYHFNLKLLEKIEPGAFSPPPKVFSRLLYFKPRYDQAAIPHEEKFWEFIKFCFKSPRQTLKNNLKPTHFHDKVLQASPQILALRAQQLSFEQFLELWGQLI